MTLHPIEQQASIPPLDKWQRMLACISQYPAIINADLSRQFNKMVIGRWLMENVLLFLLQYTGLMFTTLSGHPTPLWFASGTAIGFIFMRGYTVLPGIWLGSFIAYLLTHASVSLALLCASLFSLQAGLLLWICYRYVSPTLIFYTSVTFAKFIGCAALITAMITVEPHKPLLNWLQAWLANFDGILIIACAIVTWDMYFPQIDSIKRLNLPLLCLLYGLLTTLVIALIFSHDVSMITLFALSTLPITIIISLCYGWCGALAAVFLSGVLLSIAGFLDAPLFMGSHSSQIVIGLQVLLAIETILVCQPRSLYHV